MSCCARPALPTPRPCCDESGAAYDPEWTVTAARTAALGIVGVSNLAGESLGSGFWITSSIVCTAWDVVAGQAGGVRVLIPVSYGPPMLVDALYIFGAQQYGLALLEVQPALFLPGYLPVILPIGSATALIGQSVYTLGSANALTAGAFVAGSVRDVTFSVYGDVSYLTLDLALGYGAGGAPVLRRCDNSVIGVALYYRYAPGDVIIAVSAATLAAFLVLAGKASIDLGVAASGVGHQTLPVLTTPARLTGSTTFPTPADTPTLGIVVPYIVDAQPPVTYSVTLPCMTEAITPQKLTAGETASGMWAYDPTLISIDNDCVYGTLVNSGEDSRGVFSQNNANEYVPRLNLLSTDDMTAYSCNQNFTRLTNVPVIDITTIDVPDGSHFAQLNPNMSDPFYGMYNLADNTQLFDWTTDSLIYASDMWNGFTWSNARSLQVYAAGLVVLYDTPYNYSSPIPGAYWGGTTEDGLEAFIRQSYPVPPTSTPNIIAPFASTDFIYRGDNTLNPGQPGYALEVSAYRDNTVTPNRLTVQWKGFSQVTGDPVLFQVMFTVVPNPESPFEEESGQVLCLYGTMPGTWAGGPWLTASTLTLNFAHLGWLYGGNDLTAIWRQPFVQLLRAYQQPAQNEAIYFGRAAAQASLAMSVPVAPAPTTARFLVPWRTPGGKLPAYDWPMSSDINDLDLPFAQGTTALLWLQDGELQFQYAITGWRYDPTPLRIAAVGSKTIGTTNTNLPSLLDTAVALRAIGATQRVPAYVGASLLLNVNSSLSTLSNTEIASLLASARLLGAPGATVDLSSLSSLSFVFNPAPPPSTDEFTCSSVVMTLPTQCSGGTLPNIVSITLTLVFDTEAVSAQTESPLIVVQLAAADSTSLVTSMTPNDYMNTFMAPSAIVVYGGGSNFSYCLRNGAGGFALDGPTNISVVDGIASVTVTLEAPIDNCTQRPNTLITGRPPRAINGPFSDSNIVNNGTLVPVTVIVDSVTVTTRAKVVSRDADRTWVITSAPPQYVPYVYPGTFNVLYQASLEEEEYITQDAVHYTEASPALIPLGVVPVAWNTLALAPQYQYWYWD